MLQSIMQYNYQLCGLEHNCPNEKYPGVHFFLVAADNYGLFVCSFEKWVCGLPHNFPWAFTWSYVYLCGVFKYCFRGGLKVASYEAGWEELDTYYIKYLLLKLELLEISCQIGYGAK